MIYVYKTHHVEMHPIEGWWYFTSCACGWRSERCRNTTDAMEEGRSHIGAVRLRKFFR